MTFDQERQFGCLKPDQNDCFKTTPSTDERCLDPAFALANPGLCKGFPQIYLKPGYVVAKVEKNITFKAYIQENGSEELIPSGVTFFSSDPSVFSIGNTTGIGTALAVGEATVAAYWQNYTAFSKITVVANCATSPTTFVLAIDHSKSMGQMFGGTTATKLDYAKLIAKQLISELVSKDSVGVVQFHEDAEVLEDAQTIQSELAAAVNSVFSTVHLTNLDVGLAKAIELMESVTTGSKVVVLFTDGENKEGSDPRQTASVFKANGGVILVVGIRAHTKGFDLLVDLATGGFFLNATASTEPYTKDAVRLLKCYLCSAGAAQACSLSDDAFDPPPTQVGDAGPLPDIEIVTCPEESTCCEVTYPQASVGCLA